jgi:hypothetical protein
MTDAAAKGFHATADAAVMRIVKSSVCWHHKRAENVADFVHR